jgi:hypothetical protein
MAAVYFRGSKTAGLSAEVQNRQANVQKMKQQDGKTVGLCDYVASYTE